MHRQQAAGAGTSWSINTHLWSKNKNIHTIVDFMRLLRMYLMSSIVLPYNCYNEYL